MVSTRSSAVRPGCGGRPAARGCGARVCEHTPRLTLLVVYLVSLGSGFVCCLAERERLRDQRAKSGTLRGYGNTPLGILSLGQTKLVAMRLSAVLR